MPARKALPCEVEGCEKPRRRRQLCGMHHGRLLRHGDVNRVDRPGLREEVRFAKMTMRGEPSSHRPDLGPCLLYTGADNGRGYAQFHYNGRHSYAHRYAWERVNGPIPAGLTIDHLCRVRCCVEITHLELVDGPTNTRRGVAAWKTCRAGKHPRTPENTFTRPHGGGNYCIPCKRERARERTVAKRAVKGNPPHPNVHFDQRIVRSEIEQVRAGEKRIVQAARVIGCNPNYLGRRIWNETRKDVLARDNSLCLCCEAAEASDVHHRRNRGAGGTTDPGTAFGMANLMSLCRTCHARITDNPAEAYGNGWSVRRGHDYRTTPVWTAAHGWILLGSDGGFTTTEKRAA